MKFKINRDHFANGLAQVLNVVGSKAAMPILSNVLLEVAQDKTEVMATDMEIGVRVSVGGNVVVGEPGKALLPVQRFQSIAPMVL